MKLEDLRLGEPPFYLLDGDRLRQRYQAIRKAFSDEFRTSVIGYSYKTNYVPAVLRILHREGAYAEVVSELEYDIARKLGVAPENIIFNGANKTRDGIARALTEGATCNLDSMHEVEHVIGLACETPYPGRVGIRINLANPEGSGHRARSRFGIAFSDLVDARNALVDAGFRIAGVHGHLSSRARSLEVVRHIAESLVEALDVMSLGEVDYIDVGGGFGFAPDDIDLSFPSFEEYAQAISSVLGELGKTTAIIAEPGISMVGDCMDYVAPVRCIKRLEGRNVVFVDGSVHTIKPSRHRHNLPTQVLNSDFTPKNSRTTAAYDVVGYTCMDDDFIAIDQDLPPMDAGDLLHIRAVGAYTIVFKPQFIRGAPAIYVLDQGSVAEARRAETVEDILSTYRMEPW
jgi:diaminopimelate decarboxylase